ncbi:glycosyltransferase family 2 protein [bacterium]|nr:glycosyltransferase family 2 protein [candidate division CSSED10-310 bacterium]
MNHAIDHYSVRLLSIVVPFYNEADSIGPLHAALVNVLEACGIAFELVFVNDGSVDHTRDILLALHQRDARVVVVDLHGNYGQTAALAAGFDHAEGDVVIAMDGDLQHDPEDIPAFIAGIEEGYDIVSGWRKHRIDPLWRRKIPSRIANWAMARLSGVDIHDFGTTFKAYRRDILDNIKMYGQFHRFIPALAINLRPRIKEVPIRSGVRHYGRSKYNLSRTFTVFFDLIRIKFLQTYLSRPLQIFGSIGGTLLALGGGILTWLIVKKYMFGMHIFERRAPLFLFSIMLLISGTQLFSLGLLGEMLAKIYHETTRSAIYGIAKLHRRAPGCGAPPAQGGEHPAGS